MKDQQEGEGKRERQEERARGQQRKGDSNKEDR